MRKKMLNVALTLAVVTAGLFAARVSAQAPLPASDYPPYPIKSQATRPPEAARPPVGVGQIEVYDGPHRTVHYVAPSTLSPGERSALNDLARAENEAAYAGDLLALKREYVESERALEPYRRNIQQQLYGFSTESTYSGYVSSGYYPYAFGYGYGYGGFPSYSGGASTTVSRSLSNSLGYEGPLKDALARQIALEATPEYAVSTARATAAAWGRVGTSERLAQGFGIDRSTVTPAAGVGAQRIILTTKGGDKIDGTLYGEDAEWFRVDTPTGTVSVRKADVSRVETPKK